jgi:hypothetical protein
METTLSVVDPSVLKFGQGLNIQVFLAGFVFSFQNKIRVWAKEKKQAFFYKIKS